MEKTKIAELIKEIENILEIEKCLSCQCFYDTLLEFKEFLTKEEGVRDIKERLSRVMEKDKVTHECLGCDPCLPVPVANALSEMGGSLIACSCELGQELLSLPELPSLREKKGSFLWPVEPGEYLVGDETSPIGITTLGSDELPEKLARKLGNKGFAIVGKTHTENIGIEKVVKNIITNPHIRFLILCGKDSRGHMAGQSLQSLFGVGVNQEKRIAGSKGKRPLLRNLQFSEIEYFRLQVEMIDLIESEDITRIDEKARACKAKNPGKFDRALTLKRVPQIEARPPGKLTLDPSGFFIIYPNKDQGRIYLEHYKADGTQNEVIHGDNPIAIASTAIERGLVTRLDYAAYLGKELEKASLSLCHGFQYIQDSAPGESMELGGKARGMKENGS